MNVSVKKGESPEATGERKPHILVASKSFKAGDVVYTVLLRSNDCPSAN